MAAPITPAPIATAIVDAKMMTLPWQRHLKALTDFGYDASHAKLMADNGFRYVLNGVVCYMVYEGPGGIDLQLPYNPGSACYVDATDGTTQYRLVPENTGVNTWIVTLPAGEKVFANCQYIIDVGGAGSTGGSVYPGPVGPITPTPSQSGIAAESIAMDSFVALTPTGLVRADRTMMLEAVGVALNSGDTGDTIRFSSTGAINALTVPFVAGSPMFLGTNGNASLEPGVTGLAQRVGVATETGISVQIHQPFHLI